MKSAVKMQTPTWFLIFVLIFFYGPITLSTGALFMNGKRGKVMLCLSLFGAILKYCCSQKSALSLKQKFKNIFK